jgi:hypothetical protein
MALSLLKFASLVLGFNKNNLKQGSYDLYWQFLKNSQILTQFS